MVYSAQVRTKCTFMFDARHTIPLPPVSIIRCLLLIAAATRTTPRVCRHLVWVTFMSRELAVSMPATHGMRHHAMENDATCLQWQSASATSTRTSPKTRGTSPHHGLGCYWGNARLKTAVAKRHCLALASRKKGFGHPRGHTHRSIVAPNRPRGLAHGPARRTVDPIGTPPTPHRHRPPLRARAACHFAYRYVKVVHWTDPCSAQVALC